MVGGDQDDHRQLFAGDAPQRLDGVLGAAVRLQAEHLVAALGQGRAEAGRNALADGAAGVGQHPVASGTGRGGEERVTAGAALDGDDAVVGQRRRQHLADGLWRQCVVRWRHLDALCCRHVSRRLQGIGHRTDGADHIVTNLGQRQQAITFGQARGDAFVAEVADRLRHTGAHHQVVLVENLDGHFREVRQAVEIRQAATAMADPREGFGEQAHARQLSQAASSLQPLGRQPAVADDEHQALASLEGGHHLLDLVTGQAANRRLQWCETCGSSRHRIGLQVHRQDQAGDLPARLPGGLHGALKILTHPLSAARGAYPTGYRTGQGFDVAGQGWIVIDVPRGVIADHVDDRRVGATGVVQVGNAVGEARAEVGQGHGRLAGDASVTVGGAGTHALEQRQYGFERQRRVLCNGRHQGNLGGSRVGKAVFDSAGSSGLDQ